MARHWPVAFVLICALALALVPFPRADRNGLYNTFSGWMWCRTESACLHEIGHRLDQEAGWISHSKEFGDAAKTYVLVEFAGRSPSKLAQAIISQPGMFNWNSYFDDPPAEIYATVFAMSCGGQESMPEVFRSFYDWERAEALIQKIIK